MDLLLVLLQYYSLLPFDRQMVDQKPCSISVWILQHNGFNTLNLRNYLEEFFCHPSSSLRFVAFLDRNMAKGKKRKKENINEIKTGLLKIC